MGDYGDERYHDDGDKSAEALDAVEDDPSNGKENVCANEQLTTGLYTQQVVHLTRTHVNLSQGEIDIPTALMRPLVCANQKLVELHKATKRLVL